MAADKQRAAATPVGAEAIMETPPTRSPFARPRRRLAPSAGPILITPQLDSQLAAFDRFRRSTINLLDLARRQPQRPEGGSSLHPSLFGVGHHRKGVPSPTFALFHSAKVGAITEFVEEKSSPGSARISKVVGSLVAAARFTHAAFEANAKWKGGVSSAAVDQLVALHTQCCSESRLESNFNLARPPKAWLTWEECQRARARAEGAVDAYKGEDADEKLALLQTACLLRLLTGLPPDRVGVYRQLQLGSTLKQAVDGSYQIDLSRRGAHKTSATFGPTRTTVTPSVASRIDALVQADGLQTGEYLFHLASDRSAPLAPAAWTRYVQATFERTRRPQPHPVWRCPKACRSSFVTWLRSGDHRRDAQGCSSSHASLEQDGECRHDKNRPHRYACARPTVRTAILNPILNPQTGRRWNLYSSWIYVTTRCFMSTKRNKCIGTTIADGTMSSRAGGSTPSMDVISAKTLEVVLRVMHEFTLGERKHIGIGLIASDVVWEKWTSEILSRVEKKRRTWKTSTLTTGNGGRYTSLKYMDGIIVKWVKRHPEP